MTPSSTTGPPLTCPGCAEPYDGGRWIGHEVEGVYDGTLYWSCGACGIAWSRDWTGFGRRAEIAQRYVDVHNYARKQDV